MDRHEIFEAILSRAKSARRFDLAEWEEWASRSGLSTLPLADQVAAELAQRFWSRDMEFSDCDAVCNWLWGGLMDQFMELGFPPLFQAVYDAFDEGEYHRASDRSDDPVADHTVPMIAEIMQRFGLAGREPA